MFSFKFRVLGKPWTMRALDKVRYKKKHGTDSVALTRYHKRKVDLGPYGLDLETIIHELVHVYLYEMCTGSADLTTDDLEEIFAELLSKRGREILDLADELHGKIVKVTT